MSMIELKGKTLAALLVLMFGLSAMAGCASTGEDCGCAEDDVDCKERCLQEKDV